MSQMSQDEKDATYLLKSRMEFRHYTVLCPELPIV